MRACVDTFLGFTALSGVGVPTLNCMSLNVTDSQARRLYCTVLQSPSSAYGCRRPCFVCRFVKSQSLKKMALRRRPIQRRSRMGSATFWDPSTLWTSTGRCIPSRMRRYRFRPQVGMESDRLQEHIMSRFRTALFGHHLADRRRPAFRDRRGCERRGRFPRTDRDRRDRRGRGDCVCRCVHGLTGTRVNRHASGRGRGAADADRLGSAAGATWPCIWMRAPGEVDADPCWPVWCVHDERADPCGPALFVWRISRAGLLR